MTSQKIIEKLAKLRAHADSAERIGNQAEAEAFAAMFQSLLIKHKIEMSDVDLASMERDEPVEMHLVEYERYDPDFKRKKVRQEWSERLARIVARAHFCEIVVHSRSNRLSLVGRKPDVEVAEYLVVVLQRLARRLADREYVLFFYEMRAAGDVRRAPRVPRRVPRRLHHPPRRAVRRGARATRLVHGPRPDERGGPGGRGLPLEQEDVPRRQHHRRVGPSHGEGDRRGSAAADAVDLRANAVGDARPPRGRLS